MMIMAFILEQGNYDAKCYLRIEIKTSGLIGSMGSKTSCPIRISWQNKATDRLTNRRTNKQGYREVNFQYII